MELRSRRKWYDASPVVAVRRAELVRLPRIHRRFAAVSERDVLLASYPKSGNTWVKFLVASLIERRDVGFDEAEIIVPSIEAARRGAATLPEGGRLIKTHDRYRDSVMRVGRAIYVVRDGRDVAASYYFHYIRTTGFQGSFSDFLGRFVDGRLDGFGPWHRHVIAWLGSPWSVEGRLLTVRYEELLADPAAGLSRIASFLHLECSTSDRERAIEWNTAAQMRAKESSAALLVSHPTISFVRKADSGGWREVFSHADLERFLDIAGPALTSCGYDI